MQLLHIETESPQATSFASPPPLDSVSSVSKTVHGLGLTLNTITAKTHGYIRLVRTVPLLLVLLLAEISNKSWPKEKSCIISLSTAYIYVDM